MFERAYIQDPGDGRRRHEETLVQKVCQERGIPWETFVLKRMQRRQLPLTRNCFVCGDMDAMHAAMKQLGIEITPAHDYPECLRRFLHRRVWRSTLGAVSAGLYENGAELFVKPAGRRKVFTGRVLSGPADLYFTGGVSRQEPVWCSEVVEWLCEARVYVVEGVVRFVDNYGGNRSLPLDKEVVESAVAAYQASGAAPAGYGIDFGVLSTGETALVEVNDGYALGAYPRTDAEVYVDLLFARWQELVSL